MHEDAAALHADAARPITAPDFEAACLGEPTLAAGLFFPLNVLKRQDHSQHTPLTLARLFQHIATLSGIDPADPILLWTASIEPDGTGHEPTTRDLRLWTAQLRRYCWRNARLTLGDIVCRAGFVTLTRTDIDITMPIESADIRIRRIGLDLDPGWLPWFGRVVRFHYSYRGETGA